METYSMRVTQWDTLIPYVKGKKSHQFSSESVTGKIYFNSSGVPLYVSDDSPFIDMESYMKDVWTHLYYYNKTEVPPMTAIDNFWNGTGSIYSEYKAKSSFCWLWCPRKDFLGEERPKFSISKLLTATWYTIADAIS